MKKAIFLDRDGVINVDHGYTHTIDAFDWVDGVKDACRELIEMGYELIVITNQAGIGRGLYSENAFHHLTHWMKHQFAEAGAPLLDVYYCPHHPTAATGDYLQNCSCRKPQPGMIISAQKQHQLTLTESWLVGDKASDMLAATNAGIPNRILVRSGKPITPQAEQAATAVLNSVAELPNYIKSVENKKS